MSSEARLLSLRSSIFTTVYARSIPSSKTAACAFASAAQTSSTVSASTVVPIGPSEHFKPEVSNAWTAAATYRLTLVDSAPSGAMLISATIKV